MPIPWCQYTFVYTYSIHLDTSTLPHKYEQLTSWLLKGHWTIFENFLFSWISFIMWKVVANLQIPKEKFKYSFRKWRNHQFLLSMHKVGMWLSESLLFKTWLFKTKMSQITFFSLNVCICPENCTKISSEFSARLE